MQKTLADIAKTIGGEVIGDDSIVITGLSGIENANEGDLSFIGHTKYIPLTKTTKATALIVSKDIEITNKPVIRVDNPSLVLNQIVSLFVEEPENHFSGVHETAVIADQVKLGNNVTIWSLHDYRTWSERW